MFNSEFSIRGLYVSITHFLLAQHSWGVCIGTMDNRPESKVQALYQLTIWLVLSDEEFTFCFCRMAMWSLHQKMNRITERAYFGCFSYVTKKRLIIPSFSLWVLLFSVLNVKYFSQFWHICATHLIINIHKVPYYEEIQWTSIFYLFGLSYMFFCSTGSFLSWPVRWPLCDCSVTFGQIDTGACYRNVTKKNAKIDWDN